MLMCCSDMSRLLLHFVEKLRLSMGLDCLVGQRRGGWDGTAGIRTSESVIMVS